VGVITHVPCSKLTNIVALMGRGAVALPNFQSFLRIGALLLIAIPRMTLQAHLHALAGPTIGLSFALGGLLISPWRWLKKSVQSKKLRT
jgi:hypothetical protein